MEKSTGTKNKKKSLYEQYSKIKKEHMDAIVLLQVGGFYQTYYYDAVITAEVCTVNLTCRPLGGGKNCISCGFPVNSIDDKASALVLRGYKVVVCTEAINPETEVKTRDITRVHEVRTGQVIDISLESKEYFDKYEGFSDEDIRKEYNLAPKKPRKKNEELNDVEEIDDASILNQINIIDMLTEKIEVKEDLETLNFTRSRFIKPDENNAEALLAELNNVAMLHLSPYKALKLINYWQEKYGTISNSVLPWKEM